MDQTKTGRLIRALRQGQNLTQAELGKSSASAARPSASGNAGIHLDKDTTPFPR